MVARWLRQASAPESQHHHGFLLRLVPSRPYGSGTCGEGAIQQLAPLRWPVPGTISHGDVAGTCKKSILMKPARFFVLFHTALFDLAVHDSIALKRGRTL